MRNYRLVELRANLTMKEQAEVLGIPLSTYAMIETGRRFPRKNLLVKIAKHFGVSIEYLFFNGENRAM